jgi:hypothetical protein
MHQWKKTYKSEKYNEMREAIAVFESLHGKKDPDDIVTKRAKPACKFCSDKICLCKLLKVPENKPVAAVSEKGPGEFDEEESEEEEDDESIFSFEYEMKEYNDYIDHLCAYYHVKDEAQQKKNREEEQELMALEHGGRGRSNSGNKVRPGILKNPLPEKREKKESKFGQFKNNNEDADQEQLREFIKSSVKNPYHKHRGKPKREKLDPFDEEE